jgi:hypothetical protein
VSEPDPHRGLWQAQGADIEGRVRGGVSKGWSERVPPTKAEGLALLARLATLCEARERALREKACEKAKRYVRRAPVDGYVATGKNKPFYVEPRDRKRYKGARIDLDIKAGKAFTG